MPLRIISHVQRTKVTSHFHFFFAKVWNVCVLVCATLSIDVIARHQIEAELLSILFLDRVTLQPNKQIKTIPNMRRSVMHSHFSRLSGHSKPFIVSMQRNEKKAAAKKNYELFHIHKKSRRNKTLSLWDAIENSVMLAQNHTEWL